MTADLREVGRLRVGVLWRAEPSAQRPAEDRGLAPLFDAFGELQVDVVPVPFGDDRLETVHSLLSGLDGLLVWVNPIQDGVNRRHLDDLLREAATGGLWVSGNPAVIDKIGTKGVLYSTRQLGWGSDTDCYRSAEDLAERLPERLALHGRLVVKQGRGNGGNGVWSVALVERDAPVRLSSAVDVREAQARDDTFERIRLGEFVERCRPYFAWSRVFVDQEYQHRLSDGMIRCYFSHGAVVGFCHQWPRGLLESNGPHDRPRPPMEGCESLPYQRLRRLAEREWVPEMAETLGLQVRELPVVWDADFLLGQVDQRGEDTYVLAEINASAVWPFPPSAAPTIAANAVDRVTEARRARRARRLGSSEP